MIGIQAEKGSNPKYCIGKSTASEAGTRRNPKGADYHGVPAFVRLIIVRLIIID
jgi:hypothetical protein